MGVFKAAAVQMRSGTEIGRNAADFERLVREAAARGAVYVQTPEMTGALMRDKQTLVASLKPDDQDLIAAAARRLAAELGIHIHVGSTAIARSDGKVANRAFLFGPDGRRLATYDKIHMFDVTLGGAETYRESAGVEPGKKAVVVEGPLGAQLATGAWAPVGGGPARQQVPPAATVDGVCYLQVREPVPLTQQRFTLRFRLAAIGAGEVVMDLGYVDLPVTWRDAD